MWRVDGLKSIEILFSPEATPVIVAKESIVYFFVS